MFLLGLEIRFPKFLKFFKTSYSLKSQQIKKYSAEKHKALSLEQKPSF